MNTKTGLFSLKAYKDGSLAITDLSFSKKKTAIDAVECTIGDRLPALSTRRLFNGANKYSSRGIKLPDEVEKPCKESQIGGISGKLPLIQHC